MSESGGQLFTIAQIAMALNVTAKAIRLRLGDVPADGMCISRGKEVKTWKLPTLPAKLQQELGSVATERGFKSVEDLLALPPQYWTPPIPWQKIAPAFQERACKVCEALSPVIQRQHELPGPELFSQAAIRYREHFGTELATDQLRYILDRTAKRDGGLNQFQRPELWLEDAAFNEQKIGCPSAAILHKPLLEHLTALQDKLNPTLDDRCYLLHKIFSHYEALTKQYPSRGEQRSMKYSLIVFVYRHVPSLYRPQTGSPDAEATKPILAMRRLFNRRLQDWVAGGRSIHALRDERIGKSGRKADRCPKCEKLIRNFAANLRGPRARKGNVSLAIKHLLGANQLCVTCSDRLTNGQYSRQLRERITPNAFEVAATKGPDAVRKIAPTHHCDWSDIEPGDRFVIDDMTTNELAWDEVDGEVISGQVQLLYTEDEASAYPLPFWMYFGAPNSQTIKKAIVQVITKVGLPHVSLFTERGVFNNRMLAGERKAAEEILFREFESGLGPLFQLSAMSDEDMTRLRGLQLGLRDPAYGLRIQQARSPQAKTVERTFYEVQKSSSLLPGFRGFNQRNEASRAKQDFDRRVAAGKEHPGNEYLHISELRKNYERICEESSNRPINGTRHRGRTPFACWSEAICNHPLRRLPVEMEHLIASHRIPGVMVRTQGICVKISKFEQAWYYGESTGPLVNRKVSVFINYSFPEFIHIEDPHTHKLLRVERILTKRTTATQEELAIAKAARRAHISGARGEAGNIKQTIESFIIRDNNYRPADMEKGRAIGDAIRSQENETAQRKVHLDKIKQLAIERGDDPEAIEDPEKYIESVERERAIRARLASKQASAQKEP